MGRNNLDFQNQVLYHGSPSAIPVGGLVEPRKGLAHATPDLDKAKSFANGFFGGGKGTVHVVEPLEGDDSLFVPKKKPGEVRSEKGFRVVGHVNG
jgi:hypothetical protein